VKSRHPPRFLRKRRPLHRLPLWAVLLLLAWALAQALSDTDAPSTSHDPFPPASVLAAPPRRFEAQVVRVADGDTLTARTADGRTIKVRLARIDAPETGHGSKRPGQPFGEASTRSLRQLVSRGRVVLECPETDRYQRQVCWVFADRVDVNLEQVRRGMAWVYPPPRISRRERRTLAPLMDAQQAAQKAARGLWIEAEPVAPWDWRRQCWQARKCTQSGR